MVSVFKRTHRKAIPANATITETNKAIPGGAKVTADVATWTDRAGCKRTAKVKGGRVILKTAEWTNGRGQKITAPVDHTGENVLIADPNWHADYLDERRGRKRRSTGTSDKAAAERIAKKWEADAQLLSEGVRNATTENLATHAARPIVEHIDAFIEFRATKGGTENHRNRTRKHIEEFVDAGGWKTIADIKAEDVTAQVAKIKATGKSARTIENRLQSIKSFTRWLNQQHRLQLDPLSMITKPNPKTDRRHERRMLLPDEWPWLQRAVEMSTRLRNGMEPAERLILYRTAIQTGLRAGELRGLTRGKLILSADPPHILCKPAGTKNRKPAKQYIDAALAADLDAHVARKHPKAPVFAIVSSQELSQTIEDDLKEARTLWVKSLRSDERTAAVESDFLCKSNHEGEHLVFHSLRHTCGAWLSLAGEHPKTVQTVMRHGTITLTMDTYGHLFPGQTEQAPVKLAAIMSGRIKPTGTQ
jgi:integrase